jgi:hypothetical protein
MLLTQVRMHQQAFSDGPVSSILATVKDKLPAIAAQAGVTLIVSKWAMPFHGAGVDAVDVTLPIVTLFHPTAQTLAIIEQMKSQDPIPFEQLGLDPDD